MGDEMNQVIDKVAEKIGIAVEVAGPIAETMLREIVHLGIVLTVAGVVILVTSIVIGRFLFVKLHDDDCQDKSPYIAGVIVVMMFGGIGTVGCLCEGLGRWLAPTMTLLESLR